MKWNERMNTVISVGETYLNRDNVPMRVIEKVSDNEFHAINNDGAYNYNEYGNGYIVKSNGGFGYYPNHMDLIKKL